MLQKAGGVGGHELVLVPISYYSFSKCPKSAGTVS